MNTKQPKAVRRRSTVVTRAELALELERSDLTAEEEKLIRMKYGITVDDDAPLESHTDDPETLGHVARLEASILKSMRESGAVSRKDLIIAQLKARKG